MKRILLVAIVGSVLALLLSASLPVDEQGRQVGGRRQSAPVIAPAQVENEPEAAPEHTCIELEPEYYYCGPITDPTPAAWLARPTDEPYPAP